MNTSDVIIIGGGIVGLTLACLLAKRTTLSITILESNPNSIQWSSAHTHHRVSAIAISSQRIFESINAWELLKQKRISPFTRIQVWDAAAKGEIQFDAQAIAEPVLGFIIENNAIQSTLAECLKRYPNINYIPAVELSTFQAHADHVALVTATQQVHKAKLAVAADGANSWLREQAGIAVNKHDYEQEAIVATVTTAMRHDQCARQVFLNTGPLAFLPLADAYTSSIVWSLPEKAAKRLMALAETNFKHELAVAFSQHLGEVTSIERRFTFPLQKQQTTRYVKQRLALVGDAAHTVHPLAGQGVNMGLLDAASLADVVVDAIRQRRDFASLYTLRRYERWRKADNLAMMAGVDVIKQLFASDKQSVQILRSCGLNLTNKIQMIKNMFTRHAIGNRSGLPSAAT